MDISSEGNRILEKTRKDIKCSAKGDSTKWFKLNRWVYARLQKDYTGYIVTNQHRYWLFGGSYDWYWLYAPSWDEIGPLGPDIEYFTGTWGIKYIDGSEMIFAGEN